MDAPIPSRDFPERKTVTMTKVSALATQPLQGIESPGSCYLALLSDILEGRFPVGAAILESALCQQYGVSRTPVREALALLEHDGLIERAPRGYRIRSGTPQDVFEIYEARIALESAAAAAAAARGTRLDVMKLEHLVTKGRDEPDRLLKRALHSEWHVSLWQAGHNVTIGATLHNLAAQLRIYDHGLPRPSDDLDISDGEHADILAAIRSNDAERAGEFMREHLSRSRDLRLQTLIQDA